MTDDELREHIALGGDSVLEFKRVSIAGRSVRGPMCDAMADELAAMANSYGGTFVLGVDDKTRQILGIPLDGLAIVETWIREICNDDIKPALNPRVRLLRMSDARGGRVAVVRIDVTRSLFVHESPGGYFRRIGSSKRRMPPEALARLLQERSQSRIIRFDESVVPLTTPAELDHALTGRFLRHGVTDDALRKLHLVADDLDGKARLTLAGVLLCTREPRQWLGHAYIQAVSYVGGRTDVDYQTDARDIGGPLDDQVGIRVRPYACGHLAGGPTSDCERPTNVATRCRCTGTSSRSAAPWAAGASSCSRSSFGCRRDRSRRRALLRRPH